MVHRRQRAALCLGQSSSVCKRGGMQENMFYRKQEFYYMSPCFSSQASKAAKSNSFSLRSAVAARCLNRRRKAGGTLKASASRLAVFTGARGAGGGAIRCAASGMGAACSLVRARRSTEGRRFIVISRFHEFFFFYYHRCKRNLLGCHAGCVSVRDQEQCAPHVLPQGGHFLCSDPTGLDLQCGFAVCERLRIHHALMHAGWED